MTKSGQCRATAERSTAASIIHGIWTPKIGEEFQKRIGLFIFNLIGPILGQALLRLGLTEAIRRRTQLFLHVWHGQGF